MCAYLSATQSHQWRGVCVFVCVCMMEPSGNYRTHRLSNEMSAAWQPLLSLIPHHYRRLLLGVLFPSSPSTIDVWTGEVGLSFDFSLFSLYPSSWSVIMQYIIANTFIFTENVISLCDIFIKTISKLLFFYVMWHCFV